MQFSQNPKIHYAGSFKAQTVMLPSLKSQIFQFWSKFVSFTQVTSQQIGFSKLWLCHFLVYMAKLPHAKKLRKPTE